MFAGMDKAKAWLKSTGRCFRKRSNEALPQTVVHVVLA
jgi:hypothetical protein